MMLYHVRVSVAGERSDETKIDLTEDQLEQQFLQPYRQGRPITVNGRVIDLSNLERLRISRSERSAKEFIPQLKADDQASSVAVFGGPSYVWRAAAHAEDVTDELISGPPGQETATQDSPADREPKLRRVTVPSGPGDGRSVFLVHGRNAAITRAMTDFLHALDLKVIEWEQAVQLTGEPNPYIGDVLAAGLEGADAVVVLATPDDIVQLDPTLAQDPNDPDLEEAKQPRQNVIYEAGMAMALAPTRTLIVATPGTKILSDIAGRHLAYLDNSPQARKRVVGRLQTIGLAVDDSGLGWLDVGNFVG
jgi:predicted nucleotide-binding protein